MTTAPKEKSTDFACVRAYPVSYADILEARKFKKNGVEQGEAKFGGQFLMDPTPNIVNGVDESDLARLKREITKMLQAKAPGKKLVPRRMTQDELDGGNAVEVQIPWADGTVFADKEKAKGKDGEYARGKIIVKAKSNFQPAMAVALSKTEVYDVKTVEQFATAAKYFYSGAILLPTFGLHWYSGIKPGDPMGVGLYLNTVVFIAHGTKLGGGGQRSAAETFKGYVGAISEEDPTGGVAEELSDVL
jgi:hypothetical protein